MRTTIESDLSALNRLVTGRAFVLGDDVDSFALVARRHRRSAAPALLGRHLLRSVRPALARTLRPGDVLVAGRNFGYRVWREHAVMAILGAGVRCVVAASFARGFARVADELGLVLLESPSAARGLADGEAVRIDRTIGTVSGATFAAEVLVRVRPGVPGPGTPAAVEPPGLHEGVA